MNKNYIIYVYVINQYFYVGLTNGIQRRDKDHKFSCKDSLYKFCHKNHYDLPPYKILEEGLNMVEAQSKEDNWKEYYISQGYIPINQGATGIYKSSLGHHNIINKLEKDLKSVQKDKYDDFLSKAKNCQSLNEFRKNYIKLYEYGRIHGWLSKIKWKDNCKRIVNKTDYSLFSDEELFSLCNGFKTKTELSLNNRRLYDFLRKEEKINLFFPPKEKPKFRGKVYTDEECLEEMSKYSCKSELYKNNSSMYNYCRYFGKLSYYNKRESKKEYLNIKSFNKEDVNLYHTQKYLYDNKTYIVDSINCKIYLLTKNKIHLHPLYTNSIGLKGIGIDNKFVPYHIILQKSLGYDKYNMICYKDGNFSNVNVDNIIYTQENLNRFAKVDELKNKLINEKGELYDTQYKMLLPLKVIKGRHSYNSRFIDKMVYKYHHGIDDIYDYEVVHKDGDLLNDCVDNLTIVTQRITEKDNIIVHNRMNLYEIYITDFHGQEYFVCKVKNAKIIPLIKSELIKLYNKNNHIEQWIEDYINKTLPRHIESDFKLINIKVRTESSGCYWSSYEKKWVSQIYYKEREWQLGKFETFEEGKLLYDIASLMIKYRKFENWYNTNLYQTTLIL